MIGLIVLIYGIVIGSFLNVCIYRIPNGESIVNPPSHCGNCNHRLGVKDLVPIFSYILLGGKCRYCKSKVSPRYLIVELTTGLLFLATYLQYGISFYFFKYAVFILFMIVIGLIDYDTTDVFSITTYSAMIAGVIFLIIGKIAYGDPIKYYLLGALVGGGVIWAIFFFIGGMGKGDIEIFAVVGIFLGLKLTILTMFLSFVLGGLMGVILIALKKKLRSDYIPFGPSISLAAIVSILVGQQIISAYIAMC